MSDNIIINENTPDQTSIIINGNTADQKSITVNTGSAVTSVNNRFGAVVLSSNDVGLSAVDNTSDLNKPISNATLSALNVIQSEIDVIIPELDSVYNNVNTLSGKWGVAYTYVIGNSAIEQAVSSFVNANSANIVNVDTLVNSTSGNWNNVYNTVQSNSALKWNYQGTDIKALTGNWQGGNLAYTNLTSNSAAYLSAVDLTLINSTSGNWNTAYTNLISNSAAYLSAVNLSFLSVSGNWNSTYSTVQSNSATNWNYQGTDLKALSGNWQSTYGTVSSLSANWNSAYASTTALNLSSGNWNSVYSNVNSNSATWSVEDRLTSSSYQVVLGEDGRLNIPGVLTVPSLSGGRIITVHPFDDIEGFYGQSNIPIFQNGVGGTINISNVGVVTVSNQGRDYTNGIAIIGGGTRVLISVTPLGWVFNSDGSVTFPDNSIQDTAFTTIDKSNLYSVYSNVNSLSGDWNSVYSNVNSNSANNESVYSNVNSLSGDWNQAFNNSTVYANNSASYATYNYVNNGFLPLSGGIISGETRINNNLTVFGNLTATGTTTFANTLFSVTSSLSVVHIGSGPALWVGNNGDGDIASFYDIDQNIEILHVGGINSTYPNVGIKTSTPNVEFTVNGQISSNNIIWSANGNSTNWNSAFNISTSYQNASGSFATNTLLQATSALLTPLTTTNTLTSQLVKITDLNTLSATLLTRTDANTLTSLLVTNTAFGNYQTSVAASTATLLPTSIYQNASGSFATNTLLQSTSALLTPLTLTRTLTGQLILNTAINSLTGNWNTAYASTTALNLSSGNWNSAFTTLCANSATWVKFQPVPEYLADDISDVLYDNYRYPKINSNFYFTVNNNNNSLWITRVSEQALWEIWYSVCGEDCIDYLTTTSLTSATYPWQATWPLGTIVTKASAIRVIGQPLAATGTEGTSQWSARADHKHPYPTYTQIGAAAASHTHPISQVVDLQSNLDAKATLNPEYFIDNQVNEILAIRGGYGTCRLYKQTDPFVNYYGASPYSLIGESCFKRDFFYGFKADIGNAAIAIGWDGVKWIARSTNSNFNGNATNTADWPWYCTFNNNLEVTNNDGYNTQVIGPSISPTLTIGEAAYSGASDKAARADHKHTLPYQAPDNDHQDIFITVPSFTYFNGSDTVTLNSQFFDVVYEGFNNSGYWPIRSNRKLQYSYGFQYNGGGEDPNILTNFNLSWTINGSVSAWKLIQTVDNQMGSVTTTVAASSLSNTTYPWDATWTPSTIITRQYNVTPLVPSLSGSAGISPYISRADHTHPSELYYTIVNSNFNAIANRKYIVNTTSSNVIGTLPSSPALGDNITFIDSNNTWSSKPLILNNNGNLLQTFNEPLTANISGYQFQLVYVGGLFGWKIV